MPSDELDRDISEIVSRVVTAWVQVSKEIRMRGDGEFKPLVTWPPGTEYLNKVSLPEEEPIGQRIVEGIRDVFSRYDLKPDMELVLELVSKCLSRKV